MKWNNLKEMRCPKCSTNLVKQNGSCEFFIREEKFDSVAQSLYKPKERSTESLTGDDRLSELNNYGREPLERYE